MAPPEDNIRRGRSASENRPLRTPALVLVYLLTAQYLLGMYINLFVPFSPQATESGRWGLAWSDWATAAHITLALFILAGTAWLCLRAWQLGMRRALWLSLLTLLSLVAASASGALFITTQANAWSYSMAVFFIIAVSLLSYVLTARRG